MIRNPYGHPWRVFLKCSPGYTLSDKSDLSATRLTVTISQFLATQLESANNRGLSSPRARFRPISWQYFQTIVVEVDAHLLFHIPSLSDFGAEPPTPKDFWG